jgi:hypothetical protein
MRTTIPLLILSTLAAPAAAQQTARTPSVPETQEIQRALNDPVITERLTTILPALGEAMLNMPVGEIKAAAEGRRATAGEKRQTVRDLGRAKDPNFDRNLRRDLAASGETMKAGMRAMANALPAMMEGMQKAMSELEKATANLPSPVYPKQ